MATANINQFEQSTVRGALVYNVPQPGLALTAMIDAAQATALEAGDAVKLVETSGNVLKVVAAGTTDAGIGNFIYNVNKSSPEAGDFIEIATDGFVMWMVAGGTIAAMSAVEDDGSGGVVTLASAKIRGIALTPASSGQLVEVKILTVKSA